MAQATLLRKEGYEVTTARTGELAVQLVTRDHRPYDIVLMDIDLGSGMDGTQAAERILAKTDVPVLFVSSHTEPEVVAMTERITSYGYVVKNSGSTVLLASIRMAFKLHDVHKKLRLREEMVETALAEREKVEAELIVANERLHRSNEEMEAGNEELREAQEEGRLQNESLLHTQSALRESEARFRAYFEQSAIGVAITSPEMGWMEVNDRVCEMLGYPREELARTTWAELTHPSDLEADESRFDDVLSGRAEGYSMDKRFLRNDGTPVWVSMDARCLRNPDGSVRYFISTLQDISERKKIEDALKIKDFAIAQSADGVAFSAPDGLLTFVNPAFLRMWGYEAESQAIGKSVLDFWVSPCEAAEFSDRMRAHPTWKGEMKALRADGTTFDARVTGSVVRDETGEIACLMASFEDVTDGKRIEDDLKKQKKLLRDFVDCLEDPVQILNPDGEIMLCNSSSAKVFGCTPEKLVGRSTFSFFPESVATGKRELLEKAVKTGDPIRLEETVGGLFYDTQIIPIKGDSGAVDKVAVCPRDITYQVRAREDLSKSLKEKEALLVELQHRIKNSFSIITGLVELEAARAETARERELLQHIQNKIGALTKLYDILYANRSIADVRLDHYLEKLCSAIVSSYSTQMKAVGFSTKLDQITLDVRRAVPIGLILNELVTNSIKHAFPGGRDGSIRVSLERESGVITLEVADDGVGLPRGLPPAGPSCMGMMIVEALTGQIRGEMELRRGEGATFRVRFPEAPPAL